MLAISVKFMFISKSGFCWWIIETRPGWVVLVHNGKSHSSSKPWAALARLHDMSYVYTCRTTLLQRESHSYLDIRLFMVCLCYRWDFSSSQYVHQKCMSRQAIILNNFYICLHMIPFDSYDKNCCKKVNIVLF